MKSIGLHFFILRERIDIMDNNKIAGVMSFNGEEHIVAVEFVNNALVLHFKGFSDITNFY